MYACMHVYMQYMYTYIYRDRLLTSLAATMTVSNFHAQLPGLRLPPSMDTSPCLDTLNRRLLSGNCNNASIYVLLMHNGSMSKETLGHVRNTYADCEHGLAAGSPCAAGQSCAGFMPQLLYPQTAVLRFDVGTYAYFDPQLRRSTKPSRAMP